MIDQRDRDVDELPIGLAGTEMRTHIGTAALTVRGSSRKQEQIWNEQA